MSRSIFFYLPFVFFIILIAGALLIANGPSLGGPIAVAYDSLRAMLTTADESPADPVVAGAEPLRPRYVVGQKAPAPAAPAPLTVPVHVPGLPPASAETCVAMHFAGALVIQDGRLSFGRFTPIQDTYPFGSDDPLAHWKLLQFESLPFTLDKEGLKVAKAVNMLLSDPFTQTPLLSARWQVEKILVRGQHAGINATLQPNLSEIRIDNAIDSAALAQFESDTGILTMHFEHNKDILDQIAAEKPVFAQMQGTLYARRCLR